MGAIETEIYRQLEQEKQLQGWRVFRHTVGKFFQGKIFAGTLRNGSQVTVIKNCRTVKVGEKGESDLFCMIPRKITSEDVGKVIAQFGAIEVKTLKYKNVTYEQIKFLKAIVKNGGKGYICRETKEGYDMEEIR